MTARPNTLSEVFPDRSLRLTLDNPLPKDVTVPKKPCNPEDFRLSPEQVQQGFDALDTMKAEHEKVKAELNAERDRADRQERVAKMCGEHADRWATKFREAKTRLKIIADFTAAARNAGLPSDGHKADLTYIEQLATDSLPSECDTKPAAPETKARVSATISDLQETAYREREAEGPLREEAPLLQQNPSLQCVHCGYPKSEHPVIHHALLQEGPVYTPRDVRLCPTRLFSTEAPRYAPPPRQHSVIKPPNSARLGKPAPSTESAK